MHKHLLLVLGFCLAACSSNPTTGDPPAGDPTGDAATAGDPSPGDVPAGDPAGGDVGGDAGGDAGSGDSPPPQAQVAFDVTTVTTLDAAEVIRPSVTAYLIDDYDQAGVFDSFLADFDQRVGLVLYDGIDDDLHHLAAPPNTTADLAVRLAAVDATVSRIVAAGGTALIGFNCAMPDFLSSRPGATHYVLSGENEPAQATVSACSPVRNEVAARDGWVTIMQAVGTHFSTYGDQVVYMFGSEPDNFFAGTAAEMFDTYGLAISGIRAGHPTARVAGITPVGMSNTMSKAVATYDAAGDRYTYEPEALTEPLLKLWVEYAVANGLPVDFTTFHIWHPSSRPRAGAWFDEYATQIESWLAAAGYTGPPGIVLPTDFAAWENTCLVDADDQLESFYDSEYLGAMFVDHAIAATQYNINELAGSGAVRGVRLVYGYLMDMQSWVPCMPVVGGFGGFPGIVTGYGVPKPAYNALHLMTGLEGALALPVSNDAVVSALGAYQSSGPERASLLLARHLPSELHYVAPDGGYAGHSFGSLFRHTYGFDRPPLADETPSALLLSYAAQPDHPRGLVHDLLAEPSGFEPSELGLSAPWIGHLEAARVHGRALRAEAAESRAVQVRLDNLAGSQYRLQTFAVDIAHGNAYRARDAIQAQIDAIGNDPPALAALAAQVKIDYGVGSTAVDDLTISTTGGAATVTVDMEPNSVWLVVLTAN